MSLLDFLRQVSIFFSPWFAGNEKLGARAGCDIQYFSAFSCPFCLLYELAYTWVERRIQLVLERCSSRLREGGCLSFLLRDPLDVNANHCTLLPIIFRLWSEERISRALANIPTHTESYTES